MRIGEIHFGDIDAKNEIRKQEREGQEFFFASYVIPRKIDINQFEAGEVYFILGLKGTGKTALIRYLQKRFNDNGSISRIFLFKSEVSEIDRQALSKSAGYEILSSGGSPVFFQDFKESWKWFIYKKIAEILFETKHTSPDLERFFSINNIKSEPTSYSIGSLFSRISVKGRVKLSAE